MAFENISCNSVMGCNLRWQILINEFLVFLVFIDIISYSYCSDFVFFILKYYIPCIIFLIINLSSIYFKCTLLFKQLLKKSLQGSSHAVSAKIENKANFKQADFDQLLLSVWGCFSWTLIKRLSILWIWKTMQLLRQRLHFRGWFQKSSTIVWSKWGLASWSNVVIALD